MQIVPAHVRAEIFICTCYKIHSLQIHQNECFYSQKCANLLKRRNVIYHNKESIAITYDYINSHSWNLIQIIYFIHKLITYMYVQCIHFIYVEF